MIERPLWIWLAVAGFGVTVGAVSCSLDSRALSTVEAAAGGSASGSAGGLAAAGADLAAPAPLPVCDYAGGVMSGCETLVKNADFSKDTFGWSPEDPTVTMTWVAADANSNRKSGSIAVLNSLFGAADGIASRAATQCLPTEPGTRYGFAADLFIPKGQGDGLDGGSYQASAGLSLIFFTSAHCNEFTLSSATSVLLEEADSWAHREGHAVAPTGAQSMLVRLVAFKNFREYAFEAHFDNVLLKAE
jgi:hypothetical protein